MPLTYTHPPRIARGQLITRTTQFVREHNPNRHGHSQRPASQASIPKNSKMRAFGRRKPQNRGASAVTPSPAAFYGGRPPESYLPAGINLSGAYYFLNLRLNAHILVLSPTYARTISFAYTRRALCGAARIMGSAGRAIGADREARSLSG